MTLAARQIACLEQALVEALTAAPGITINPASLVPVCDCFRAALEEVVVDVTGTVALDAPTLEAIQAAMTAALEEVVVDVQLSPADMAALGAAFLAALEVATVDVRLDPADIAALCACFTQALEDVVVDVRLDPASIADIQAAVTAALEAAEITLDPASITALVDALQGLDVELTAANIQALVDALTDLPVTISGPVTLDPASIQALCDCITAGPVNVRLDPADITAIGEAVQAASTTDPVRVEIVNPQEEFDKLILCDANTRLPVILVTTYSAAGVPTTAGYNLNGSPYTNPLSTLVDCAANTRSVESDPVGYCDANGVSFIRWFNTLDGSLVGTFDTDLAGAAFTPVAPVVKGSCAEADCCADTIAKLDEILEALNEQNAKPTLVMGQPICAELADGSFATAIPYATFDGAVVTPGGFLDSDTLTPLAGATPTDPCNCPCITCV